MSQSELSPTDESPFIGTFRVKPGVMHPEIPEISLTGWECSIEEMGTLEELEGYTDDNPDTMYAMVTWAEATLEALPDFYYLLCGREDVDSGVARIPLEDLERIVDPPVPMAEIPLDFIADFTTRDTRIRMALGIPDDVEIPEFSDEVHNKYHAWLCERMEFPFEAVWEDCYGVYDGSDELDNDDEDEASHVHGPDCQHDHAHHHEHADGQPCDHDHDNLEDYDARRYDVTVTGLVPAEEVNSEDGVFCTCLEQNRPIETDLRDIEAKAHPANAELIADYKYWFDHFGPEDVDFGYHPEDDRVYDDPDPYYAAAFTALRRRMEQGTDDESIQEIAAELHSAPIVNDSAGPITRSTQKVGRNDPCPCGSGKKFKKCCLRETS